MIGDSAAAGVGAATQRDALSGQLTSRLVSRFRVEWKLWATSGHTTGDLLAALQTREPEPFDIVIVSVGVNDITTGLSVSAWIGRQRRLIDTLRERHRAPRILFTHMPPMQMFPSLPQPLRWYLGARAAHFDRSMAELVKHTPGCELITIQPALEPQHLASDGFHPGPSAYAAWANSLFLAIHDAAPCEADFPEDIAFADA